MYQRLWYGVGWRHPYREQTQTQFSGDPEQARCLRYGWLNLHTRSAGILPARIFELSDRRLCLRQCFTNTGKTRPTEAITCRNDLTRGDRRVDIVLELRM